jgi:hypothetical protein
MMKPLWGWAMLGRAGILAIAAVCLALPAAAQQQQAQQQQQQLQQQRLRPGRFVRAPLVQSRSLTVDMEGARRQARAPLNKVGRQINLNFIANNKALFDRVSIPVFLPSEPPLAEHLRLFPNGAHYAVSSNSRGMSFHMTGHGRAFDLAPAAVRRLPQGTFRSRIPLDGIVIEHTESGIDASFNRFGAAYSIALECADPTDFRCNDEQFVRGLVARLMVVIPGESQ